MLVVCHWFKRVICVIISSSLGRVFDCTPTLNYAALHLCHSLSSKQDNVLEVYYVYSSELYSFLTGRYFVNPLVLLSLVSLVSSSIAYYHVMIPLLPLLVCALQIHNSKVVIFL